MINDRCRFTFRLPKELMDKLKVIADRQGLTVNAVILQILWKWLDDNN